MESDGEGLVPKPKKIQVTLDLSMSHDQQRVCK